MCHRRLPYSPQVLTANTVSPDGLPSQGDSYMFRPRQSQASNKYFLHAHGLPARRCDPNRPPRGPRDERPFLHLSTGGSRVWLEDANKHLNDLTLYERQGRLDSMPNTKDITTSSPSDASRLRQGHRRSLLLPSLPGRGRGPTLDPKNDFPITVSTAQHNLLRRTSPRGGLLSVV